MRMLGRAVLAVVAGAVVSATEGGDITLTPDSCRVPSPGNLSVTDIVVFTNNAAWELTSDSMILTILDADTEFASFIESEIPQVTISLNNNYYVYVVERLGPRVFKLLGQAVRTYPFGGSNYMQSPSIGYNLGSGSNVVVPARMTGLLDVYFIDGELLTVRLYTEGASPPPTRVLPGRRAGHSGAGSVAGRQRWFTVDGRYARSGISRGILIVRRETGSGVVVSGWDRAGIPRTSEQ